jgi:sedoheptulokinase
VKLLGLDIGTTTVCGLVLDAGTGDVLSVVTRPNTSGLAGQAAWDIRQDPEVILEIVTGMLGAFLDRYPDAAGIGVAGQMHGILYVDRTGRSVSPLYTWQDGRGDLPEADGQSTASRLSAATGRKVSTGMGAVTHAWNAAHGLVPENAAALCTISDYAAMRFCGRPAPRMDATNAAGLGCFDLARGHFMRSRMGALGIDPDLFPEVTDSFPALGEARGGVPVFTAAGDNQASFLGSVREVRSTVLFNVGTGSQVSLRVDSAADIPGLDVRPFPFGGYLAVGAGLCGGGAYAMLRDFFKRTVRLFGGADAAVTWDIMNAVAPSELSAERLSVDTRFRGTRNDPSVRGSISRIGADNFTPEHLVAGVREGIASELLEYYQQAPAAARASVTSAAGSGNGIRMNPALREVFQRRLGLPLRVPAHGEETSLGAALIAGVASGAFRSLEDAGKMIRYL